MTYLMNQFSGRSSLINQLVMARLLTILTIVNLINIGECYDLVKNKVRRKNS